jgi:hypothetical protein
LELKAISISQTMAIHSTLTVTSPKIKNKHKCVHAHVQVNAYAHTHAHPPAPHTQTQTHLHLKVMQNYSLLLSFKLIVIVRFGKHHRGGTNGTEMLKFKLPSFKVNKSGLKILKFNPF